MLPEQPKPTTAHSTQPSPSPTAREHSPSCRHLLLHLNAPAGVFFSYSSLLISSWPISSVGKYGLPNNNISFAFYPDNNSQDTFIYPSFSFSQPLFVHSLTSVGHPPLPPLLAFLLDSRTPLPAFTLCLSLPSPQLKPVTY